MEQIPRVRTIALILLIAGVAALVVPESLAGISAESRSVGAPIHTFGFGSSHPAARWSSRMVWDGADGYLLLFGGSGATGVLGDTWTARSGGWTQVTSSTSPPARSTFGLVYDAADHEVVLFGGSTPSGNLGDTWVYSAGTWTQIFPTTSPSARFGVMMAYDVKDGYVVLFGGDTGTSSSSLQGDTWTFLHGNWTKLSLTTAPPPRRTGGMTYDLATNQVVLFGGLSYQDASDTWTFTGGAWTARSTAPSTPEARVALSLAYDAKDHVVVLFGGRNDNAGTTLGDTWVLSGGAWTKLNATSNDPSQRQGATMAFDPAIGALVLFGGNPGLLATPLYQDTHTFSGGAWT